MQKARTWKRVSAMVLTIAMLVGMLSVLGGLTTSAATTEQMKFKANFADLAAIADNGGAFASATTYRPGYTADVDKDIKMWVDEKFDMYGGKCYFPREFLGQSSSTLITGKDTWSGENYWNLTNDGSIQLTTLSSGQMLRSVEGLTVKANDKAAVLAIFEAKVTFSFARIGSQAQAVVLAFHEDETATIKQASDYHMAHSGSMVVIGNGKESYSKAATFGMSVYDHNNTLGTDGAAVYASSTAVIANTPSKQTNVDRVGANTNVDGELFTAEKNLVAGTKYDLIVKVVGTALTATVKETATDTVVYTRTKTLEKADSGYLTVAAANGSNRIYALEVQALDEKGLPVAFGTNTETDELETLKVDFADVPEVQWYGGKYYYNAGYDTSDVNAAVDMNTDFLTAESTTHIINQKETILVDYLESKFGFFYGQESWNIERWNVNGYMVQDLTTGTPVLDYNSSDAANTKSTASYHPDTGASRNSWVDGVKVGSNGGPAGSDIPMWTLQDNRWLRIMKVHDGDGSFRQQHQVALKDANGELAELENFELDMDFYPVQRSYDKAFLAISFRSSDPAKGRGFTDRAMFAMSPRGGYLLGSEFTVNQGDGYIFNSKGTGNSGNTSYDVYDATTYATATADFTNAGSGVKNLLTNQTAMVWPNVSNTALSTTEPYHLYMKVVGNKATVIVTKVSDASEALRLEDQPIGKGGAGYLTIGCSNYGLMFGDLEVTRLDSKGNAVDFTIDADEGDGEYEFVADFQGLAATYRNGTYYRDNGKDFAWMESAGTAYTFDTAAADDVAAAAYLSSKFNFYVSQEGQFAQQSTPYGISSSHGISGSNYSTWKATGNTWLTATYQIATTTVGGEMLRSAASLVPKLNGEEIVARNVETTFDVAFNTADSSDRSAIVLSLRSQKAGRVTTGYQFPHREKLTVILNTKGVMVLDKATSVRDAAVYNYPFADETLYDAFTAGGETVTASTARVYVKLVHNTLTVRVNDLATGTEYFNKNYTVSYTDSGFIYYSITNRQGSIGKIGVNVLDGDGAPIDIEDMTAAADRVQDTFNASYGGLFAYNSAGTADARIPAYLRQAKNLNGEDYFGVWSSYTHEHIAKAKNTFATADGYTLTTEGEGDEAITYLKDSEGNVVLSTEEAWIDAFVLNEETGKISITRNQEYLNNIVKDLTDEFYDYIDSKFEQYYIDTDVYKGAGAANNGWGSEARAVYVNHYLQFGGLAAATDVSEIMGKADHTPIDQHISVMVPKNADGSQVYGSDFSLQFRVRLDNTKNYGTAYIGFNMPTLGRFGVAETSNGVINFDSDVNAIKINKSEFQLWNGTAWVDLIPDGGYVGYNAVADITLAVTDGKLTGTVQYLNKTAQAFEVDLTNTHDGYFAIGHNGGSVDFGTLTMKVADERKLALAEQTEGGKITVERTSSDKSGMYKYIVTATADAGWQLKANTLRGTDANGETVYPAGRVGFQSDMNGGDTFYFYSAEDITFGADFYTARYVSEANMTILGTSYNNEKVGVRFVGRMYMTEKDGVKYTEIDGKLYKVVDYGMLFAVQAGLDWGEENGLGSELVYGSDNPYIKKASAVEHQKHYDIAANYVDVSATVTGLGGREETEILSRGYLVVEMAEGVTAVAYTEKEGISFCEASGKNTVTYLNAESGNDANAGTAGAPVKTLAAAIAKTVPNGEVVNQGTVTLSGALGTGNAKNGVTLSGGTYNLARHTNLNSPVTFADTTLVVTDTELPEVIYANGHKFVVKEDVTMEGALTGLYGGCYQGAALDKTELEIYAGNYYSIYGGSSKAYVAESHITVGGTTNAGMKTTGEANHNVCIWGGGNEAADTGDTYITFGGNAYAYMIYGGSGQGGTISGDTHVTINGGEVAQVFGGCDRVSMTGDTNVTINAGTVTRRIYGGCYNETNLISWDSEHHVTGNTTVTLYEAANITNTGDYECGIWATSRYKSQFADENSTLIYENAAAKAKFASKLGTAFCDPCKTEKVGI